MSTSMSTFMGMLLLAMLSTAGTSLGAVSSIEISSMARPQASETKKWLKLLNELGVSNVRLRTYQRGDQPTAEDFGTEATPRVRLLALLNERGELVVPGGKFTLRDRSKLADYLKRAGTEGAGSVTAKRGMFGLTEAEFGTLFKKLSQPLLNVSSSTKPSAPKLKTLIEQLNDPIRLPVEVDPMVVGAMQVVPEGYGEIINLGKGTALAILLRGEGLALHPQSKPGQGVILKVVNQTNADASKLNGAKLNDSESKTAWPIGYRPEGSPRETFPKLFERIDVEIDGYTLAEAIGAVGAQLEGMPIVWDRFALRSNGITPETLQVKLAKTRTYYKRILDKLLFQARLKGELRIDEMGQPFYWITK